MEKTTRSENIGVFKLSTAEEVVTEFDNLTADSVTFIRPRSIVLMQAPNGKTVTTLAPWIYTEEDGIYEVDRNHIIAMKIEKLDPKLVQGYLKNTTGLDVQTAAGNIATL